MRLRHFNLACLFLLATSCTASAAVQPQPVQKGEEVTLSTAEVGQYGGTLVIGERAEPKTFNPVLAADGPSREVLGRMMADLIHINRVTQRTEPGLAASWKVSKDSRTFTLKLRRGIRFSDGVPFSADDVVFSFRVYLDEQLHSPQRDLLLVAGKPITVEKVDDFTVRVSMAQPYAAAERLFDSIAMLPRHALEKAYTAGAFAKTWALNATPAEVAGLGPFRLKQYVPGQKLVLERNPYYWKVDQKHQRLPYLDEIVFAFVGNEDAQVIRFQSGETDLISRISAENFASLGEDAKRKNIQLLDAGPSLEYNFLVFNQNNIPSGELPDIQREQAWFRDLHFRQAVSAAIDRKGIARLVFQGRGAPLWGNVTPGNRAWMNTAIARPERSIETARELLKQAGFSWASDGKLLDRRGQPVKFTIITSSSNAQRIKMATIISDDLAQLGMQVQVVPLEFRAVVDRVFQTNNYEACILTLGGGDADPNPEMNVWLSDGSTHIWNLHEKQPATPWEAEVDRLMREQMVTVNTQARKRLYDRVQALIAENLPVIFLATPDVLVGAKSEVGNFHPAAVDPYVLWNADELYLRNHAETRAAQ